VVVCLHFTLKCRSYQPSEVAQYLSGRCLDLRSLGHGFDFYSGQLRNNIGPVIHTYVPLSPGSITWYWLKDGDILRLGR